MPDAIAWRHAESFIARKILDHEETSSGPDRSRAGNNRIT
jgi:hypothetical protein